MVKEENKLIGDCYLHVIFFYDDTLVAVALVFKIQCGHELQVCVKDLQCGPLQCCPHPLLQDII